MDCLIRLPASDVCTNLRELWKRIQYHRPPRRRWLDRYLRS